MIRQNIQIVTLIVSFVFICNRAHASRVVSSFYGGKSGASSSSGGAPSDTAAPTKSQTGIRMAIGLSLGSGSVKNRDGTIASRSLNSAAIESHIGFKSRYFEPFIYGEYEYAQQATAASTVSNTNLTGYGFLAGPGVAIDVAKFSLTAAYLLVGTFTQTQTVLSGQSAVYSNPTGYRFAIDYEIRSGLLLTASYRAADYSTYTQAGAASDISSNKLSRNTAGLSLSWGF